MPLPWKPAALVSLLALPLSGCRVPNQDSLAIGGVIDLPGTNDALQEESLPRDRVLAGLPAPVPLNRAAWRPTRFEVPSDRPPHRETYTRARWFANSPRDRGAYPTPLSALDPAPRRWDDRVDDQWLVVQSLVEDVVRVPFLAIDAMDDAEHVRGGNFSYARARRGPWLGEIVGTPMPGDPLTPPLDRGAAVGEPGVIRRFAPVGDRPETAPQPTETKPAEAKPDPVQSGAGQSAAPANTPAENPR